jgi:DNA-3-methyladenine glycosylase
VTRGRRDAERSPDRSRAAAARSDPALPTLVSARPDAGEGGAGSFAFLAPGGLYPTDFYDRDPRLVARELLGALVECRTPEGLASGRIVETEAYLGPHDPACHAIAGRTARTWHLHGPPGIAYVYRIYGMHWCFNAVTLPEGIGSAVLVRAVEPVDGVPLMRARRARRTDTARAARELTNGPGKLCAALGIDGRLDGLRLDGTGNDAGSLAVRAGAPVRDDAVVVTPRIGITRAADWPLRYLVADSPYVSRTPAAFPRQRYG